MGAEQSRIEEDDRQNDHGEKGNPVMLREIARMDQVIRSKVRTGVQYNMKLILRGERGCGKTSLWRRFQGMGFLENYVATPEIQSATINWSYRNGEDSVKVDVWDVVDKAIKPKSLPRFDGGQQGRHKVDYLDASIIDVYQDASAVVFLINPNSISSLTYVRNMAREVPLHITILVLMNFRDLLEEENSQTSAVQFEQVESLCCDIRSYRRDRLRAEKHLDQGTTDNNLQSMCRDNSGPAENSAEDAVVENNVFCFQISLLNCFGLLEVNQFLDIPFLSLKQQSLKKQLLQAQSDLLDATEHLQHSVQQLRESQHYNNFATRHNRNKADHNKNIPDQTITIQHDRSPTQEETEENDRSHKLSQSLHQRRKFEQEQLHQMQLKQQQQQQSQYSLKLDHFDDNYVRNTDLMDETKVQPEGQSIRKSKSKNDSKTSSKHSRSHSKNNGNTDFGDNNNSNKKTMKIDSPRSNDVVNGLDSDSGDNNHPFFEGKEKKKHAQNKKPLQINEIKNGIIPDSNQQFDQEVASFTPMGQDLENFLQISDDEERFMRQQKDKIRQYAKPSKSSKDIRKTDSNSRRQLSDDDDDDDDNDFGDRFVAKKTVSSSSRLQPARRLRPSADL